MELGANNSEEERYARGVLDAGGNTVTDEDGDVWRDHFLRAIAAAAQYNALVRLAFPIRDGGRVGC
jgi:hypothetical protein